MPTHAGDVLRAGNTAFTATETNLTSLFINGTPRHGIRLMATHQGVTGGTNDVSTLHSSSGNPTAGTFTLTLGGRTTAAIAFNAAPATIQANLIGLQNCILQNVRYLGSLPQGSIAVTGSATGYAAADVTITFQNQLGSQPITLTITATGLTGGGTNSVVHTTTGVGPTCAITFQDGDDNATWDANRKFGTLDVPIWGGYRPTLLAYTARKYLSATLTFGGTGTFKNLQLVGIVGAEGFA